MLEGLWRKNGLLFLVLVGFLFLLLRCWLGAWESQWWSSLQQVPWMPQMAFPGPAQQHSCKQLPGSFPMTPICRPASFPLSSTALSMGSFPVNVISTPSKWFFSTSHRLPVPCGEISSLSALICDFQPVSCGPVEVTQQNITSFRGVPPHQGGVGPASRSSVFWVHAFLGYFFLPLG